MLMRIIRKDYLNRTARVQISTNPSISKTTPRRVGRGEVEAAELSILLAKCAISTANHTSGKVEVSLIE